MKNDNELRILYLELLKEIDKSDLKSKINILLQKLDICYPDLYQEYAIKGRLRLLRNCLHKLLELRTNNIFKNSC